jgi:hypothetical protein
MAGQVVSQLLLPATALPAHLEPYKVGAYWLYHILESVLFPPC